MRNTPALRSALAAAAAVLLLATARPADAQLGMAAGFHGGTMGFGADFAVRVHERLTIRTGGTFSGLNVDMTGRFGLDARRTAELSLPAGAFKLGADLQLQSARLGAGVVVWSERPQYAITLDSDATIDIGGVSYTSSEVSTLTAAVNSNDTAPYVLLGFGDPSRPGLGLIMDMGVVLLSDASLDLTATGDPSLIESAAFQSALQAETASAEEEQGAKLNYFPIVSLALRYGF